MSGKMHIRRSSLITIFFSLFITIGLWATSIEPGWLVILDGTSSAGKSSVARHIKTKLLDKTSLSFSYESLDDFNTRKEEAEAKQKEEDEEENQEQETDLHDTPSKSSASRSLERSENSDERSEDNSKSHDSEDADDSQADYLQYIKDLATSGKHVIGDTVLRDDQDIKEYKEIIGNGEKIICAMVYCPAIEIPRRVEARNISGNKDEERTLYQAIAQIPDMFSMTTKQTNKTIDSITKKDVNEMLKPLKKELEDDNKKKRKEGKKEDNIPKTLQALRKELEPKKGKISYIQPKMPHDIVAINSRKNGPAVAAEKIVDHIVGRIYKGKSCPLKKAPKKKKRS